MMGVDLSDDDAEDGRGRRRLVVVVVDMSHRDMERSNGRPRIHAGRGGDASPTGHAATSEAPPPPHVGTCSPPFPTQQQAAPAPAASSCCFLHMFALLKD
jgi:hypothetical protein